MGRATQNGALNVTLALLRTQTSEMTPEIALVFAVLAGTVVLFVTEWFRVDVVALLVLLTLAWLGLVEPREALDGGEDGLDCIRVLVQDGPDFLSVGGFMALEVGDGQASVAAELMRERLGDVEVHKDYTGRDRIVAGFKKAA